MLELIVLVVGLVLVIEEVLKGCEKLGPIDIILLLLSLVIIIENRFLSRRRGIRVGREKENVEVAEQAKKRGKVEFDRKIVEQPSIQGKSGVLTL